MFKECPDAWLFCDEPVVELIPKEDIIGYVPVGDDLGEICFSPCSNYFAGLELYLSKIPEKRGSLRFTIEDGTGKLVEEKSQSLENAFDQEWFVVRTQSQLKPGEAYYLRIYADNLKHPPAVMRVYEDYAVSEVVHGDILIGFGYSKEVFTPQEKVLISLLFISIWSLAVSKLLGQGSTGKLFMEFSVFILLVLSMSSNYMYNIIDNQKNYDSIDKKLNFSEFGEDSERLVQSVIYADQEGIGFSDHADHRYGLGNYLDLKGEIGISYKTDPEWLEGYSRSEPAILLSANALTRRALVRGNTVRFSNGEEYKIREIVEGEYYITVFFDTERLLSKMRNGDLDDIVIRNRKGLEVKTCQLTAYQSQVGLQGKIFKYLSRLFDRNEKYSYLHLLCSFSAALVFAWIIVLLKRKYNTLLAGCFYITFLFSPWIVSFARNLYWLEFTWFIPMLIGLLSVYKENEKKVQIACGLASYIAILGKCLCGYEYISSIMIGLLAFPLAEMAVAFRNRDRKKGKSLFFTVLFLSIAAFLGFATALCAHAWLRGNGMLWYGLKTIFSEDILRRTLNADLQGFDRAYWPSMNASIWETIRLYFVFPTDVIFGVGGNMFIPISIIPLCIFTFRDRFKQSVFVDGTPYLYLIFLLGTLSWHCLAKSHSFVHTHYNYVLWYFGFVQICMYTFVAAMVAFVKNLRGVSQ